MDEPSTWLTNLFVPDGEAVDHALLRTTHLAIAAHQDDIEMMAAGPVIECFEHDDRWFSGVIVTDGRGAPRSGRFAGHTDDEIAAVRVREQYEAARLGHYAAQVMLGYPSARIKDPFEKAPVTDLVRVLKATGPECLYTHNLADKHDTHVAVALRTIEAVRQLSAAERPKKLYGCEVWRGLDWMPDEDKVRMDLSSHMGLQLALLEVFESQIAGGKRYDLACMGRRRANATFSEPHAVDAASAVGFAMDMTPLIEDDSIRPEDFIMEQIERFSREVGERLGRLV